MGCVRKRAAQAGGGGAATEEPGTEKSALGRESDEWDA